MVQWILVGIVYLAYDIAIGMPWWRCTSWIPCGMIIYLNQGGHHVPLAAFFLTLVLPVWHTCSAWRRECRAD